MDNFTILCIYNLKIVLIWIYLSFYLSIYLSICLSVCLSVYLSIYLSIYPCCSHLEHRTFVKRVFSVQFLRQSVGLLGRGISPTQVRYLHRATQPQNKRRQISMSWVGFELTIPTFKRPKTFHSSERVAIVISDMKLLNVKFTSASS
jgi:hypothetical protein